MADRIILTIGTKKGVFVADGAKPRRHLNLFVNSDNVRDLDGVDTMLTPGDTITILPAVSGG